MLNTSTSEKLEDRKPGAYGAVDGWSYQIILVQLVVIAIEHVDR